MAKLSNTTRTRVKSLRATLTKAEVRLWARLKGGACDGFKFRRQHPVGSFITDFACTEVKLIAEVDGDVHSTEQAKFYDATRTQLLETEGWQIIRFSNEAVLNETQRVIAKIAKSLHALTLTQPAPSPPIRASRNRGGATTTVIFSQGDPHGKLQDYPRC